MDTRILFVFCVFAIANINAFTKRDVIADIEQDPVISEAPTGFVERLKYCYSETLANTVDIVRKEHLQPLINFFEHSWNRIRRIQSYMPSYNYKRRPITWEEFQSDLKEFRKCFRQTLSEILDDVTEVGLQPLFRHVEDHLGKLTKVVDVLTMPKDGKVNEKNEKGDEEPSESLTNYYYDIKV